MIINLKKRDNTENSNIHFR